LFEEEGDAVGEALLADLAYPVGFHGARAGARFAADNDPLNAAEREARERADKGFERKEANVRGNRGKAADAMEHEGVFDAGPHPDIWRPGESRSMGGGDFGTLC